MGGIWQDFSAHAVTAAWILHRSQLKRLSRPGCLGCAQDQTCTEAFFNHITQIRGCPWTRFPPHVSAKFTQVDTADRKIHVLFKLFFEIPKTWLDLIDVYGCICY